VQNQFWGDGTGWIMDPSGHVWTVATCIEEPSEDQRRERWSNLLENKGAGDCAPQFGNGRRRTEKLGPKVPANAFITVTEGEPVWRLVLQR
jgi:hypothetical protein